MALYKEIRQNNGIRTNYHRILFIQATVNKQNSIAVLSYENEDSRESEKNNEFTPYRQSTTYEADYNEAMTVEDAYAYLKTLDVFIGAEDV